MVGGKSVRCECVCESKGVKPYAVITFHTSSFDKAKRSKCFNATNATLKGLPLKDAVVKVAIQSGCKAFTLSPLNVNSSC